MKKILYVELNQDGTVGGSHHCLLSLVKCLDKEAYAPAVMFYENSDIIPLFSKEGIHATIFKKPLGKEFQSPNAFLQFPYKLFQRVFNFIHVCLLPFFRAVRYIAQEKIDIVHLNNSSTGGWEWLWACKLLRRKCVCHQRYFFPFAALDSIGARFFDRIICVSESIQAYLHEHNVIKNTVLIYDALDAEHFAKRIVRSPDEIRNLFSIEKDVPLVGMVGNLQEWKGQATVVRAMARLRTRYENIRCLLVGSLSPNSRKDQDFHQMLLDDIRVRGLSESIMVTGYRRDVPDIMNALDVIIHASLKPEPFGMVILEGMSLGKPVIASDLGGPREIIHQGVTGFLIPPGDDEKLAEAIARLLDDADLRAQTGGQARDAVRTSFHPLKFSQEIHALYAGL